jgi:hypothetical protein
VAEFGAILLGISAYQNASATCVPGALRYPARDADAFESYLRLCWPNASIRRIPEADATLGEIQRTFAAAGREGPYELFLIYLSGHGVVSAEGTGFLLQPEEGSAPALPLLSPAALDHLLKHLPAQRVVFVLDCCFAEALVAPVSFFSTLGDAQARLFIASSRADQVTWEAEDIGHGIFTALLVDFLKADLARDRSRHHVPGRVDVDTELFPFLCEQVPLYVFERKRKRQEPVKGGVMSSPIYLPAGVAQRALQPRTTLATALRRVRQIALGLAVATAVFIAMAYGFVYRAEIDTSGEVVLVNGPSFLRGLTNLLPHIRVHTGVDASRLAPDSPAAYQIRTGTLIGIWTQMSLKGYRRWFDQLSPALIKPEEDRYQALGDFGSPAPSALPDPIEARPIDVARVSWRLSPLDTADRSLWVVRAVPGSDRVSPLVAPFPAARLDFGVLDLSPTQLGDYASALRFLSVSHPDAALQPYLGFLKSAQEWLYQNQRSGRFTSARADVIEAVSSVITTLVRSRTDRALPPLPEGTAASLLALAGQGYFETAGEALANTQDEGTRSGLRKLALSRLGGKEFDDDAQEALSVLEKTLDGSPDARTAAIEADAALRRLSAADTVFGTAFLIQAAKRHSLPSLISTGLLVEARASLARGEPDFIDGEHARVLAHALSDISPADRGTVYQLIRLVASDRTPLSGTLAEIYGALGRSSLDTGGMFEQVVIQTGTALEHLQGSVHSSTEDLPGAYIGIDWPAWPLATAEFATNRIIPPPAVNLLRRAAALKSLESVRGPLIAAIARQRHLRGESPSVARGLENLRRAVTSVDRDLEADVLAESISQQPRAQHLEDLASLRALRSSESEPEIRIALGRILVGAQLDRFVGSRLAD